MDSETFDSNQNTIKKLNSRNQSLQNEIEDIVNEKQKVTNNNLHNIKDFFRNNGILLKKDSDNSRENILKNLEEKITGKNKEIEYNEQKIKEIRALPGYAEELEKFDKANDIFYASKRY